MISAAARPYIDASVPVLRDNGVAISTRFYTLLFKAHPELKNIFNMANQENGSQQQALASALFAYAANIDNANALAPVISRIVHKHVSLGIRAEHYPIVGHHLLAAIGEVLGEAATPELIAAWAEAYGALASTFIAEEKKLYASHKITPGQQREVIVTRKQIESETVTSFYLESADGLPLPAFVPGQYISIATTIVALNLRQFRQYSLSGATHQTHWRISVKREDKDEQGNPAGMVSNLLHAEVNVGDKLWVSPACGDFVIGTDTSVPLILISAGVGITPMMSMLHGSLQQMPARAVHFLYATLDGHHHPLKTELNALKSASRLPQQEAMLTTYFAYATPTDADRAANDFDHAGYLELNQVDQALLPKNGDYYLCGPTVFMQIQRQALLARGVAAHQIQQEVFGPALLENLQ
ncbi:NO-inducible flavohemoprotein [Glaciimonas immobilis]|uniref:Flavohemoprotein n=1 Tax=Glaciimonas immobilis TaxID=728004 RepID=A0A840RN90_9BURK|nr:NO-inducible flavohemoprotein [Glaciimonas immobilis]KAF3999030.1 NO-inducible flavohemoprotein [Glaciimonas immobilis]MBB5198456.1 nitric oxide dioxygenase [Glaciimonas immobilis]